MIGVMVPSGFSYSPCDDPRESDYPACDPCTDPSMSDHPVCSKEKSKNIDISNYCKFGESMFQCTFLPLQNFSDADLAGADLSNAELDGADLSGANLSNADLSGANLSNADLSNADLSNAELDGANLSGANLDGTDFTNADLRGVDIRHLDFTHAKIDGANFDHSVILNEHPNTLDLSQQNLSCADLSGADLVGKKFQMYCIVPGDYSFSCNEYASVNLSGADLSNADLRNSDLRGANLSGANLSGANLSNAELDGANLSGANLDGTDFTNADLRGVDIRHLDFTHAKIDGANFDHSIIYDEINSSVDYWENPIPAMATIDCSKDTDSISQTPLETTTSKLQKKLNEYWYCAIGATMYANYKDCVKYDEKHTIGIPPTEITWYQIEKDDTLTFVYEDSDISPKLETFRDQSLHQDLWEIYTSITPPEILSEVVSFVVYTDDYAETSEAAAVNRASPNPLKFLVSVDPVDMVPSGIKISPQYYISTMIHENAHILSLSASQGDNKSISVDTTNSPDMYKQEMKNGERSCAPNYYNDFAGCMNQNSYLNAFFQEFWSEIYDDFKWSLEFDDYETFYEHNTEFYFKYEKYWLTEYSSENPDEDFAESFMAFVLKEKPSAPTFAEQKILFFYQYPELVEMRDFIRSAIATFEFCDDGTVWKDGQCRQSVTPPPQQQPVTPPPQQQPQQSQGGGCLIATATYDSELAPQVQQLRELRDNQLLQTESGTSFMNTFNDIYYSFSPTIADMEREHPMFKEAVKLAITPMISSLSLMENANSESEVLSIGISVIMLNIGMYLGIPAIVIVGIKKKF